MLARVIIYNRNEMEKAYDKNIPDGSDILTYSFGHWYK